MIGKREYNGTEHQNVPLSKSDDSWCTPIVADFQDYHVAIAGCGNGNMNSVILWVTVIL